MSEPVDLVTEHAAAVAAIKLLERSEHKEALKVLQKALSRRKRAKTGADLRANSVVRVRAHIELAIVELEHGQSLAALDVLRKGINPAPDQTNNMA